MDIKQWKKRTIYILLVAVLAFGFCACGSDKTETEGTTETTLSITTGEPEGERCHFSTFNIWIPSGWTGKGNSAKLFTTESNENWSLLVNKSEHPESDAKEQLELFFSTEYYVDQTEFSYTYNERVTGGRQVEGNVLNHRLGTTGWFTGFYLEEPACYFLFFCDDAEEVIPLRILAGDCYASLENLE